NGDEPSPSENKIPFSEENITIEPPTGDIYYTGSALTPAFTLKNKSDNTEIPASEYTVTYEDNKDPGWAFVTFTSNKVSYEEGEMYKFFLIKYDMAYLKTLNTAASLISVSGNILVSNKSDSATTLDIYAYVVAKNDINTIKNNYAAIDGTKVTKGSEVKMSTAFEYVGGSVRRRNFDPAKEYTVYASPDPILLLLDESEDYTELATVKINPASKGDVGDYKNGDAIKLSAATQKSQDIKVSWKPDKKAFPEQADYASFALFTLKSDGTETKIWPAGETKSAKGKSCTVKAANSEALKSDVLMLKCFDKDGNEKAKYLTVTAPYLCAVQSGSKGGELDFRFSALSQSNNLSYIMQAAAGSNKEENYTSELSCTVPSEGLEQVVYPLSTKLSISALQADYFVAPDKLVKDNKYSFRVKSSYNYNGMIVTSAPSNALSMKAGPDKCEVLLITGEDPRELLKNIDTTSQEAFNGVHADSISTCYKKGYVLFYCPTAANDTSATSRIELLRCNTRNGIYKVAKKYKPAQVVKLDTSAITNGMDEEIKAFYNNLYYVEFNNFPPEEPWYFSVRAVSKKGAVGGAGDSYENYTLFEKVQNFIVMDTGTNTLEMTWKHDDCAKQYWIYRVENEDPHTTVDFMSKLKEAAASKPLYKVSGTKFTKSKNTDGSLYRYHTFTDKAVKNGHEYYYMIRPVYNTKSTAAYDDFEYATSVYFDIDEKGEYKTGEDKRIGVIPSAAAVAPKSVKTEAYNMLYPVIRWSSVKDSKESKVVGYRIERTTKPESETSNWTKVADIIKGSSDKAIKTAFTKRAFTDESVTELGPYEYRVCALYDVNAPETGTEGKSAYTSARYDTKPLPVATFSAGKQTGHSYRYGANLKFTIDKKDMALLQSKSGAINLYYTLESSDNGRDWFVINPSANRAKVNPYQATYTFKDDDELRRGVNRRYRVTLTNDAKDESGQSYMTSRKVEYEKPTEIKLDSHGDVAAGSGSFDLKIDYNGTVRELDGAPTTSNSDVLSIEEWDNDHVKVCPKRAGTATITVKAYQCGWGGGKLTKSVTIKVNPAVTPAK
ncbi:MAG: hypothetical protein K6E63_06635, partial [Lachnospiraceae bacterium]|nr:hypothetical protein [Lachnospiraceae bacterium]